MTTFLVRRVLLMVPTLWAIATVAFFLVRGAPGGPFQSEKEIPATAREQLMRTYGLDQPLHVQYGRFLSGAVRLDFGPSYKFPSRQVREIIAEALPVSLELGGWALLLAILIGAPIGVIAAVKQNSRTDYAAMGVALAGVSVPNFVLGPLLVLGLALTLYLLPPALWQGPESRVLPVLTLSTAYVAYIARLTRGGMLEVLRQDYIRTARAKGLSEPVVVGKHALRLGILPVVVSESVQNRLILIHAPSLLFADEGAAIDYSENATIEFDDAPISGESSPFSTGTALKSFFQNDLGGFRVTRFVNFKMGRTGAVRWINLTSYGG